MQTSNTSPLNSEPEKESYWKKHIGLLKESGLTRADYCRLHKVNYHQFGYWLGKKPHKNKELIAINLTHSKVTSVAEVPIILCTLTLGNGRALQIHDYH